MSKDKEPVEEPVEEVEDDVDPLDELQYQATHHIAPDRWEQIRREQR